MSTNFTQLDGGSLFGDTHECEFEPIAKSDFTIHYQSTSFHLHSFLLYTSSNFFHVLLSQDSDNSCNLTDRCSLQDHRCLTLEGDCIGGVPVTVDELEAFLKQMYCLIDGTDCWRKRIEPGDLLDCCDCAGTWHSALVVEIQSGEALIHYVGGRAGVVNESDESIVKTSARLMPWLSNTITSTRVLRQTLIDSPNFHLAFFFECNLLDQRYQQRMHEVITCAASNCLYESLWNILPICDKYYWKEARAACIDALVKDKKCAEHPQWKKHYSSVNLTTFADLYSSMASRR